ncbi:MAG: hypothetical protein QXD62_02470 [Candidatus Woesearchaeota archaeon]
MKREKSTKKVLSKTNLLKTLEVYFYFLMFSYLIYLFLTTFFGLFLQKMIIAYIGANLEFFSTTVGELISIMISIFFFIFIKYFIQYFILTRSIANYRTFAISFLFYLISLGISLTFLLLLRTFFSNPADKNVQIMGSVVILFTIAILLTLVNFSYSLYFTKKKFFCWKSLLFLVIIFFINYFGIRFAFFLSKNLFGFYLFDVISIIAILKLSAIFGCKK